MGLPTNQASPSVGAGTRRVTGGGVRYLGGMTGRLRGARGLQVACLHVLLLLQAVYLINGFPTKDDTHPYEQQHPEPLTNYSSSTGHLPPPPPYSPRGAPPPYSPRGTPHPPQEDLPKDVPGTMLGDDPHVLASSRIKIAPKSPEPSRTASSGIKIAPKSLPDPSSSSSSLQSSSSSLDGTNYQPPDKTHSEDSDPPLWRDPDYQYEPAETVSTKSGKLGRVRKKNKNRHDDDNRRETLSDPFPLLPDTEYEGEEGEDVVPVEQRLMNQMMRNYERSVRPVRNASETVLVRMGLTLTQIFDMDEKNQVLVTNVWLDQEWDDMFLTWNPEEFGGLQVLRLPCHKLWLPDIVLYNNAAEYTDGLMPANAMITFEGNVFWPVPTKLQSTCKVDVTYFPFDEQFCRLKFGSWTYDGFQVDMVNRTMEVDLSNYVENGEWELMSISVQRNVVFYACCPEPFPDVTFIIHIRRRTLYYMYNVIFPCIMMSALTLLVFCLPPDSGEKITMGITVLLAFSVFMLTIAEDLPETSEFIPLLSIYLTIVMAMTSVSVIMTVFVLNLHHRGPNTKAVPVWLRRLLLRRRVKRGLCFSKQSLVQQQQLPMGGEPGDDSACHLVDEYLTDGHSNYIKNVSLRLTIENLAQELKEELDQCGGTAVGEFPPCGGVPAEGAPRGGLRGDPPLGGLLVHDPLQHEGVGGYHELPQADTTIMAPPPLLPPIPNASRRPQGLYGKHACTKTNEEILNALKKIIERYERDDSEEEVMYEWRQVALAVDRVLFWIFLFGTLGSTIVVLVVAPITKWL